MRIKRWIILLIVLLLVVGCGQKGETATLESETPGPTLEPLPTLRAGITTLADGMVVAEKPPVAVIAEASGAVQSLDVTLGDTVQAGDAIATLDDTMAQETLHQAQLNLDRARLALSDLTEGADAATIASARAALSAAKAELAALTKRPTQAQLDMARQGLISAQETLQTLLEQPDATTQAIAREQLEQSKNSLWSAQSSRDAVCGQNIGGMMQTQCDGAQASVNQAEAALRIAQLQYEQSLEGASAGEMATARASVAQAQSQLDTLLEEPDAHRIAAAEANVEQAQATLDKLRQGATASELRSAEIAVELATIDHDAAQRNLDRTQITAPAAGTVVSIDVSQGARVGAGSPLVTLLDTRDIAFHTDNLTERDVVLIAPGQPAVVTLKAFPNDPIEAAVTRVGLQPGQPAGDAATYPVVVVLGASDLAIRPGMTGKVEIRQ